MVRIKLEKTTRGTFNLTKEPRGSIDLLKQPRATFDLRKNLPPPTIKIWNLPIPEFNEPPGGLIPIGDTGLYRTPSEPADPEDCERYPNSIFCGGIPLSLKPIDLGVNIVADECNIGIQAEPVIGFIKLPPVAIVYRKPECRIPKPLKEVTNVDGLELPDSFDGKFAFITIPKRVYFKIPRLNQNSEIVYAEGIQECELLNVNMNARNKEWVSITVQWTITGNYSKTFFGGENTQIRADQTDLITYNIDDYKNTAIITKQLEAHDTYYTETLEGVETGYAEKVNSLDFSGRGAVEVAQHYIRDPNKDYYVNDSYLFELLDNYNVGGIAVNPRGLLLEPNRQAIIDRYSKRSLVREVNLDMANSDTGEPLFYSFGTPYYSYQLRSPITATEIYEQEWQVILAPYSDILPPPPPKEPCCMACCPPPDNALLKLLLKKVNKLSEIVGVDEYPASVPASIISKDEGFLGNLIPNPDKEIKNLTQFHAWFFERFDEVMGQFEVPIEIKDSDPATPGEQPVGIKIPNVAEYVGESLGMQLQANINLELLVNMCTRILAETGQDKQQNFKNYMLSEAIAEYLGFEQKQVIKKMPLLFKPGEEDFSAMLQETEIEVSVPDCVEKTSLQKTIARILTFTSRAQAAVWRSLDPRGDMKGQIVSLIKGFASTKDTVQQKEQDDDDFQRFTEEAEVGFINTPGITDVEHPYGRSYAERPRIREIGNSNPTPPA